MTNRQARLLFGLLAELNVARKVTPLSGRRAVDGVAAGAMMKPADVRVILDNLDAEIAKVSAEISASGASFNDAENVARMIAIVRTVTDEDDDAPIGPGSVA